MPILPKLIYKFKAVPIKLPSGLLVEIDKLTLTFRWKGRGTRLAKTILKKLEESHHVISSSGPQLGLILPTSPRWDI